MSCLKEYLVINRSSRNSIFPKPESVRLAYQHFFYMFDFQKRVVSCTLWAMWFDRNKRVHEAISRTNIELANFIFQYLQELDGLENDIHTEVMNKQKWEPPPREWAKVNFDGAFDIKDSRSKVGVVIRDSDGVVLVSRSFSSERIPSTFAVEAVASVVAIKIAVEIGL